MFLHLRSPKSLMLRRLSIYETRLRDRLGLRKKLKGRDWFAIDQHCTARKRESDVCINGVIVPRKKLKKEIQRNLPSFIERQTLGKIYLSCCKLGD